MRLQPPFENFKGDNLKQEIVLRKDLLDCEGDDWICPESFACFPRCVALGRPGRGWAGDLEVAEKVGMEHAARLEA